jgi:hypothetical protein
MSQESNASSCLIEYGATFQKEPLASQFSLPLSHISVHDGDDESIDGVDDKFRNVEENILVNPLVDNVKITDKHETICDNVEDVEIDVILKGRKSMHWSTKHEDSAFLSLQKLLDKDDSDNSNVENDEIEITKKDMENHVDNTIGITVIPTKTPVSKYESQNNETRSISTHAVSHKGGVYNQASMITPAFVRNPFNAQTPSTFTSRISSVQNSKNTVASIMKKQQKQRSKKEKIAKNTSSTKKTSSASITPSAINYDDAFSKRLLSVGRSPSSTSNTKNVSGNRGFSMNMFTPLTNKSNSLGSVSSQWKSNEPLAGRHCGEGNEIKSLTQAQKLARATQTSSLFDKQKRTISNTRYTWNNDESDQHAFGPTFLSKKKRKSLNQDIIDVEEQTNTQSPTRSKLSNTPRSKTSTCTSSNQWSVHELNGGTASTSPYQTPQRSSKRSQGPLSRLLNSMRRSIDADSARLQSGLFAYHPEDNKRFDVNNPRNRAETIMDVTVVGDHPKPFVNDEAKVVVLGYVHNFLKNKRMIQTLQMPSRVGKIRNIAAPHTNTTICNDCEEDSVHGNMDLFNHPTFMWICLTRENYFELSVGDGKQLRLYNPIVLQSFGSTRFSIVVGTRLCEVRPMELPHLPKVPTRF